MSRLARHIQSPFTEAHCGHFNAKVTRSMALKSAIAKKIATIKNLLYTKYYQVTHLLLIALIKIICFTWTVQYFQHLKLKLLYCKVSALLQDVIVIIEILFYNDLNHINKYNNGVDLKRHKSLEQQQKKT